MKTIKDIAEEAQVSTGTIDRVLHNRGGVSKKTEEKVKRILKKNDFKINAIGRSLALNKTIKIATLIPEFDSENVFWKAPLQGINKAQEEVGIFGVAVQNFPFDQFMISSYQKQFEALLATEPDGVVIVPTFQMETRQIVSELEKKGIPYIFFNIDLEGFNNICFIGQDSYMSGYLARKTDVLMYKSPCFRANYTDKGQYKTTTILFLSELRVLRITFRKTSLT